jgi:hypothetical protein
VKTLCQSYFRCPEYMSTKALASQEEPVRTTFDEVQYWMREYRKDNCSRKTLVNAIERWQILSAKERLRDPNFVPEVAFSRA